MNQVFAPRQRKQGNVVAHKKLVSVNQNSRVRGIIQAKLKIGAPNDQYEQEADRVADQVMRMPESSIQQKNSCTGIHPKCHQPQVVSNLIQTKRSVNKVENLAPSSVNLALSSPGKPLNFNTRDFFESRFKHDFSHVRIHSENQANQSAKDINARAYTVGNSIVFGSGEYVPEQASGQKILAHELTHVVQQGAASRFSHNPVTPSSLQISITEHSIQRRTLGIAGACWFANCQNQLRNFFMIPEDGPPGFHPSGTGSSFRVDDLDGLWFKFHTPKSEWFKIPDIGTAHVTCNEDERNPDIQPAAILPFATAGWSSDGIHTINPY